MLTNLDSKTTLVLMSMDVKINKSSCYVLSPSALQDIAWIYDISLLTKYPTIHIGERLDQTDIKTK